MLRARFAAGRTARRLAIDDFADHRDDRDRAAVRFGRVGGDPVFERDRIIFPRLAVVGGAADFGDARSEEHTSELQSLMRISYAVFCLKKKNSVYTKH